MELLNKPIVPFQTTLDYLNEQSPSDVHIEDVPPTFTADCPEKLVLASYPRSGNTLIRSYFERITGIITGSDHNTELKLNKELFELGMTGEGHIDSNVWIVKSHYPERLGHSPMKVNRCILMVRSPIDSLWSFFNMMAMQSHNKAIPEDRVKDLSEIWDMFIRDEIKTWAEFHEYWTKAPQKVPTYIVRYEDLLSNPQTTLIGIFQFLLNREDLVGTRVEKIIQDICSREKPEVYKPRSGKINASFKYFTPQQIEFIRDNAQPFLSRFGYMKSPGNLTGFIDDNHLEQQASSTQTAAEHWILDFNQKMLQASLSISKTIPDQVERSKRVAGIINDSGLIDKYKSKRNAGWRAFRDKVKEIANSQNDIVDTSLDNGPAAEK